MTELVKPNSYFRRNGYTSNSIIATKSGEQLDLSAIPRFLRALLVMDGTVTKALEAWFWEPVKVVAYHNEVHALKGTIIGLEAKQGDAILQREVTLQGSDTNSFFACARSSVFLKSLPKEVGEALEAGKIGIGELFREKGLETYREVIDIDYHASPKNDLLLASHLNSEIISRRYQIWVNAKPAIIVTEFFPVNVYQ